jgi:hypothetical protein
MKPLSDVSTPDEQDLQYIQKDAGILERIWDRAKNSLLGSDPTNVDPKKAGEVSDYRAAGDESRRYLAKVQRQGGRLPDLSHPELTPDELAKLSPVLQSHPARNVVGMPTTRPENLYEFIARTGITRHEINTLTIDEIRARIQPAREKFAGNDALAVKLVGILGVGETLPQFLQRTGLSPAWLEHATREEILEAVLTGLKRTEYR